MLSVERTYCFHALARTKIPTRVAQAAKIFNRYGLEIYSMLLFHLSSASEADDIYQELFITFINKPIPSNIRNVRAYIYKTITNDVFDYAQREQSYQEKINRYAKENSSVSFKDDPEKTAIEAEQMQRLFDIIENRLPARQAQAIVLRYVDNYSIAEVAKKMGVNKETISNYVCAGIRKVRQLFYSEELEPYVC